MNNRSCRDAALVVDAAGRIVSSDDRARQLLATDQSPLVGYALSAALGLGDECSDQIRKAATGRGTFSVESPAADLGGRLELRCSALHSATDETHYLVVLRDRGGAESENRPADPALHDDLTGLPGRRPLRDHLIGILDGNGHRSGGPALLMIDLDHFKLINDSLDHEAGDAVLVTMAQRLRTAVREDDLVVRLGGDEFAVVLDDCRLVDALQVAQELREIIMAPVDLGGQEVRISASVGVAHSAFHGPSADLLLRHADVAMYMAKASVRKVAAYRQGCDVNSPGRLALLNDLRKAIETRSLTLYYQPQVLVSDGKPVRFEALARWLREDGQLVESADFIPLAEEYGLMPTLTEWAISTALADRARWADDGCEVDVTVNLSALDLGDIGLARRVAEALRTSGQKARRLSLEITETSAMSDPEQARRTLTQLRAMGIDVMIDDFGIGRSSLGYLQMLPASGLKIDKVFLCDVDDRPHNAAIVRATVALAHELGLSVTAEGVETAAALEYLRRVGCDCAQGFHIARPMPSTSVIDWLHAYRSARDERMAARGRRMMASAAALVAGGRARA